MALSEPEVFAHVLDELAERGYEPLIHVPGGHQERTDYRPVVDRAPMHRITVAGRYPDVVGFDDRDRVFAIEVKGHRDLMRGLGQALTYQQGVHATYLAADAGSLPNVASVARAHGVGCIGADSGGIETFEPANPTLERVYLPDVEGQLTYQLRRQESAGAIAGMKLTQPTNFLAPLVAVTTASDVPRPERDGFVDVTRESEDVLASISNEYGLGSGAREHAVSAASVLDFIAIDDGRIRVTEYGALIAAALTGLGIATLDDLLEVKQAVNRRILIDEFPVIGIILRTSCLRHPEFRQFIEVLSEFSGKGPVVFPRILERVSTTYPNVYLNMLCSRDGRERARTFFERGETYRLYEDREVWEDVVLNNILFNFLQQLKHMGFVVDTPTHGSAIDEYDPEDKPWIIPDTSTL